MFLTLSIKPKLQGRAHSHGREVRNRGGAGEFEEGKRAHGCQTPGRRERSLSGEEKWSLSSPCSLCVSLSDPNSLVTHKTQLPAWSQEMVPSNAPYLAATKQIQIRSGSDSGLRREKTGALLFPKGVQLAPSLPAAWGRDPQVRLLLAPPPPHALHLPFDRSEPGPDARAGGLLVLGSTERRDHECPSLGSSAHRKCQGNVSTD